MQTGTVSRLRFCGRSGGLKIYFGWNIVRFWKSYICSNKLDVQETNFSFTQFNRIRNHLFGCRIEVEWYSRSCLWDLIVAVLHGNTNQSKQVQGNLSTSPTRKKIPGKIDDLNNVDFISSNVNSFRKETLFYIFEDNEAVIKKIMKGRSPTMRHVSRTHRVALDWSFDRINLDSKIQIKYIDTKNQLAGMLTKGNFTRDEWNHLLCLLTLAISVLPCRTERKKFQVKKESQQNRSR